MTALRFGVTSCLAINISILPAGVREIAIGNAVIIRYNILQAVDETNLFDFTILEKEAG